MLQRTLGETIDLRVIAADALWPATIDAHQFENALVNLSINASDAMPKGGRIVIRSSARRVSSSECARLGLDAPGSYEVIDLSDTGEGMAPELIEHIFEPFYTTKAPGKGTGLGLAIVKKITEQHGGALTLEDVSDTQGTAVHGALVRITLPIDLTADEATKKTSDNSTNIAHTPSKKV